MDPFSNIIYYILFQLCIPMKPEYSKYGDISISNIDTLRILTDTYPRILDKYTHIIIRYFTDTYTQKNEG